MSAEITHLRPRLAKPIARSVEPVAAYIVDDPELERALASLGLTLKPRLTFTRRAWKLVARGLFWTAAVAGGVAILWGALAFFLSELAAFAPEVRP